MLRGIMNSQLAIIPHLLIDNHWTKKRVNYLSSIEGKGGLKDI